MSLGDWIAIAVLGAIAVGCLGYLVVDNLRDSAFYRDLGRCDAEAAWRHDLHPWSRAYRRLKRRPALGVSEDPEET